MTWQEVQTRFPEEWLLVEAIQAHSENGKRIVEQLGVAGAFARSGEAMRRYVELHREDPNREYYVVHTSRPELDITEQSWLGVRTA
jgi:hypothetical protein